MYHRDEGPHGYVVWIFLAAIFLFVAYAVLEEGRRDQQRVAGGKVDRENVLVVFPEQLRQ